MYAKLKLDWILGFIEDLTVKKSDTVQLVEVYISQDSLKML